jgi:hypothetical protein
MARSSGHIWKRDYPREAARCWAVVSRLSLRASLERCFTRSWLGGLRGRESGFVDLERDGRGAGGGDAGLGEGGAAQPPHFRAERDDA